MRDERARWARVSDLLAQAAERAPAEREAFLRAACGDDDDLRGEVDALLRMTEPAEHFFDTLAQEAIRPALGELDETQEAVSRTGSTIGAYHVLEEVGRGGAGVVYRAEDLRLHRPVALKFLSRRVLGAPDAGARLLEEARAASRLDDPNICTIYGVEEMADGEACIAMAYYAGETLDRRLARGSMPLRDALSIALGITRGLAAAHASGMAHRDLTPRNVMLTERDRVKILDFGLARAVGAGAEAAGTPAYMAPEQVRGAPTGLEADVWSLGVTLFELCTGHRPFARESIEATLDAVLTTAPPAAREYNARIPEALDRLLARMLSRDPARRPPDAVAVRTALEPIVARFITRRARRLYAGVVGVLTVLALGGVALRRTEVPPAIVPETRLVVLPVQADPAEPDVIYLAAYIHEQLTVALPRVRGLAVISWSRARSGENTPAARRRLTRALSAAAVLEGTITRSGLLTLHVRAQDDDRILGTVVHDYATGQPADEGRALAVQVAQVLGLPLVPANPQLERPGTFATDPRTGHVYEAVPVTLDWFEAREAAARRTHQGGRGHLVTIGSVDEDRFIRTSLPQAVNGHYWLGGYLARRGVPTEQGWRWITGEPFVYAPWHAGGPNDIFGEDGLQYYGTADSTTWNDIDRTAGFEAFVGGFIVEYEPKPIGKVQGSR